MLLLPVGSLAKPPTSPLWSDNGLGRRSRASRKLKTGEASRFPLSSKGIVHTSVMRLAPLGTHSPGGAFILTKAKFY